MANNKSAAPSPANRNKCLILFQEPMRAIVLALILIIIAPAFPGCISEVDDDHPFSGEWTMMGGNLMLFVEGGAQACSTEWNVINDTAENVHDCMAVTGMKTVSTFNYSFVGDVLFMQTTSILIEDSDGNTTTSDMSDITMCAAYVPRDMAPDESSWISEVEAVSWPNYCTEILGISS